MALVSRRCQPLAAAFALALALALPATARAFDEVAARAAEQAAVQRGDQLVSQLGELTKQYDEALKAGADVAELGRIQKQLNAKAFEVSESFHAKLKLKKGPHKALGARYHDLMKGADGKGGVLKDVMARTKKKLAQMGYPPEVYRKIELVQNEASIAAKKAPMDIDAGILSDPGKPDEARELLKKLGGASGEAKFRADLQAALEDSYQQVAQRKYGVSVDPKRAYVEGTTRWHPEAYLDAEVLKEGGVAQRSLVQQTADVSKYKVNHFRNQALGGKLGMGEALTEAARGTYKDLDKVQRVFDEIERLTGARPRFSSKDYNAISIIKAVGDGTMDPFEANKAIKSLTGRDMFESCNMLVDRMEEAIKTAPTPRILKARLYKTYLPREELEKAIRAIAQDDNKNLPRLAKALDDQLAKVSGIYLVTLEEVTPAKFLDELKKSIPDIKFKSGDEAVEFILKRLETMPKSSQAVLFGEGAADMLERTQKLLQGGVKQKVARRFLGGGVSLRNADASTRRYLQLGEPGVKALAFDGIVGAATALYQTSAIMDQNLSPAEENRQIMNAWVTSLPLVGDFAQAIIDGIEAGFEGDKGKAVRAGLFVVIGVAYCVPGGQIPAMIASLGMMAWQIGGSAWDVYKDKRLVEAWVASGIFNPSTGEMKKLISADKKELPIPPSEAARKELIETGEIGYHKAQDLNIRESLAEYAERTVLAGDKPYQASRQAVLNLYPDFDLDKALRMPLKQARVAMWTHIKDVGGDRMGNKKVPPNKNLGYALFVKLKRDIYDEALWQAAMRVRQEAEAEYQAQNMVGEALAVFQKLDELAAKLNLPLRKHVDAIFESFISWSFAKVKSPWNQHSLPRQHMELAKKFAQGYSTILEQIEHINELFEKAGLTPPKKHHLTGYLEVDARRMADLVTAYRGALATARKDAREILKALGEAKLDTEDACGKGLFEKLASLQVRMVFLRDRILLIDQWTGRYQQAQKSRDKALQQAMDRVDQKKPILSSIWGAMSDGYEAAYSWGKVKFDQSGALLGQRESFAKLLDKREDDYKKLKADAAQEVAACLGRVLVHVRGQAKGQKPVPISGAEVAMSGEGGPAALTEGEPGDYTAPRPKPGSYKIRAKAKGYKSQGGSEAAVVVLAIAETVPGQPVSPAELTITLVPVNQVELKAEFKPATQAGKPRLAITLQADSEDLDPGGLKLSLDGKDIKVAMTGGGRALAGELTFEASLKPGKHRLAAEVADVLGVKHRPGVEFVYRPALELMGVRVDDGGSPAPDGKAATGENVGLSLKLASWEPSPLGAVELTAPADDARLKPAAGNRWRLAGLSRGKPEETPALAFLAGEVTPPKEELRWQLPVTVGGKVLDTPLAMTVTVYSALALDIALAGIEDTKADGSPNNGDGTPQQGEDLVIKLAVTNVAPSPSPPCGLRLSTSSDQLAVVKTDIDLSPIDPGRQKELRVAAKVGTAYRKPTEVTLTVQPTLNGQPAGKPVNIPVRLELAPLNIKLVKVEVQDPSSGSLAIINDGNGKLGSGEHGYLTLTLVNQGPDIQEAYINCAGPNIGGFSVDQSQGQTGAKAMPQNQPVAARFQVRVPVDWTNPSAELAIKVNDASNGRSWETIHALEIEVKSDLASELKLMGAAGPAKPEEIAPGAKLPFELTVTSTSAQPIQDLVLGLRYTGFSIIPNSWSSQSFAPGAKQSYKGTLAIPDTYTRPGFEVGLDVTTASGSRTVHKNKWAFEIGVKETRIKLTPTAPPTGGGDWSVAVEVTTLDGQPVDAGAVKLAADQGALSVPSLILASGKGSFAWSPPATLSGQATIKAGYLGDVADPGQPDQKYKPISAEIKLPPAAQPTKVKVTAAPARPGDDSVFTIKVEVSDAAGSPVSKGGLEVSSNLGAFSGGGLKGSGGNAVLTAGAASFTWRKPANAQGQTGQATFAYTGDQIDPAQPDSELAPSSAVLDLPPSALALPVLTVDKALIDRDQGLWRLDVSLADDRGRPISPAKVSFTATGGSFGAGAAVLSTETDLAGGKCGKGWIKTDDQQHSITVTYPGDGSGPGGINQKFQEVSQTLKLPPEMVERSTVFVVDASGSMGGGKLASAKAAVRAALAGYDPSQGQEEWALIVFAGCGNISIRQPFTTNPQNIISALGFSAGGGTPIAAAMAKAGGYIRGYGQGKSGRVILLSDGGESCRGDPVEAAKSIRRSVRSVTPAGGSNP